PRDRTAARPHAARTGPRVLGSEGLNGIRRVTLWPEEYEALRVEAAAEAAATYERYRGQTRDIDPDDAIGSVRRYLATLEEEAPDGRDEVLAGIPCRVFYAPDPVGTYLHIHGGSMMFCTPRLNDLSNSDLAKRERVRVVSVDYRLAPEHPHPAGIDDCV